MVKLDDKSRIEAEQIIKNEISVVTNNPSIIKGNGCAACHVLLKVKELMHVSEQDQYDLDKLYDLLNEEILPLYYDQPNTWRQIVKNGMRDVMVQFDSNRMAEEYYELLYKKEYKPSTVILKKDMAE